MRQLRKGGWQTSSTTLPATRRCCPPLCLWHGALGKFCFSVTPARLQTNGSPATSSRRGVTLVGAHSSNPPPTATDYADWTHEHMTRLFFTYVERGQMQVEDLITHQYDPHEAPDAYTMLTQDRSQAMGVQFDWTRLS